MDIETNEIPDFESLITRLEEIVKLLERGDAPLKASLQLYEEGAALLASCNKTLDEAEQKIIQLKKGIDGEPLELPFNEQDS